VRGCVCVADANVGQCLVPAAAVRQDSEVQCTLSADCDWVCLCCICPHFMVFGHISKTLFGSCPVVLWLWVVICGFEPKVLVWLQCKCEYRVPQSSACAASGIGYPCSSCSEVWLTVIALGLY
jgi:hypothetical protein